MDLVTMVVIGRLAPGVACVTVNVFDGDVVALWGALSAGLRRVVWLATHDRSVRVVNDCGATEVQRGLQYGFYMSFGGGHWSRRGWKDNAVFVPNL